MEQAHIRIFGVSPSKSIRKISEAQIWQERIGHGIILRAEEKIIERKIKRYLVKSKTICFGQYRNNNRKMKSLCFQVLIE